MWNLYFVGKHATKRPSYRTEPVHRPGTFAGTSSKDSQCIDLGLSESGADRLCKTKHLKGEDNKLFSSFKSLKNN